MNGASRNIAVIGGGPAGSVAAIRLARLGHHVTLFEKSKFPRDKVCGECLSATGIAVLARLGLSQAMRDALKPAVLTRAMAVAADGSSMVTELPERMWGATRAAMDQWLAARAQQAGATILWNTTGPDIRSASVPVMPHEQAAHETGGRPGQFDVMIVSDGRGGSLARAEPTGDFGIKAHFRDVDAARDTIELVALAGGGYAGLAPVNGNLWNAAWSVPGRRLRRHAGDIEALFREAIDGSRHLRKCFARASRVGEWLACPLPRHAVRREWPRNVIPVGNAAAALEPVGGEGMGLAMRSAEMAAEAIDAAAAADRDIDAIALRRAFDRLWRTRRAGCRAAAIALAHPLAGPITVELARRLPGLARAGLALVGK